MPVTPAWRGSLFDSGDFSWPSVLQPLLWALVVSLTAHATPQAPDAPPHVTNPLSHLYRRPATDPSLPTPPTGVEQDRVDWKKANADVGEFRNGFVDILKWESAQDALKTPGAAPAAAPAHRH